MTCIKKHLKLLQAEAINMQIYIIHTLKELNMSYKLFYVSTITALKKCLFVPIVVNVNDNCLYMTTACT